MTLRRFAPAWTPTLRAASVLGLLTCVGLGVATANTDAVVAQHFTNALASSPNQIAALKVGGPVVSGSEAYWLGEKRRHESQGAALEPAAWSVPLSTSLSVGDRITISSGKAERVLQVVAISDVEPSPAVNGSAPTAHHTAVTCRDMSTPEGRLVTFLTPGDAGAVSAKFRAL